ncbi:hypothetical protein N0V88_000176 [Collariella sp. IMI 366227]|nr:hypothetical protein N0V88_000176 [Collariella sp. IMI 366227]
MGSRLDPIINSPIRVSPAHPTTLADNKFHRYWRSHEEEGYLERYWPEEEDHETWIAAMRRILAQQFSQFADADIKYFAKGTFNRLYSLTNASWEKSYIFRVSIPVEPFYKTESEIATMEYIRRHTSIPVPPVIAYSSSDNNDLGYEWILMEMMPGEPLRKLWPTMPNEARVRVFVELAHHVKTLVSLQFSKFGNIFFADVADHVLTSQASQASQVSETRTGGIVIDKDLGPDKNFVLGRIVAQDFFFDKRLHYPGSRGPFNTTRELVDMRMDLLGKRIRHLSPNEGEAWYCENDRELARFKDRVYELFDQMKAIVPSLVPHDNGPEDRGVLFHDDLSEHNLLLDPVTYKLMAVVDWESVSVLPAYETYDAMPAWLSDRDWRPTPLVLLSRGISPNDEWLVADKLRRVGEMGPSRRAYLNIVGPLYDASSPETQRRIKNKQGVAKQLEIATFQHRPWWTAAWLAENGFSTGPVNSAMVVDEVLKKDVDTANGNVTKEGAVNKAKTNTETSGTITVNHSISNITVAHNGVTVDKTSGDNINNHTKAEGETAV